MKHFKVTDGPVTAPGYFAQSIEAQGPWEARFLFCARYGFKPDEVNFSPDFRCSGPFWCSVGKTLNPFINVTSVSFKSFCIDRDS